MMEDPEITSLQRLTCWLRIQGTRVRARYKLNIAKLFMLYSLSFISNLLVQSVTSSSVNSTLSITQNQMDCSQSSSVPMWVMQSNVNFTCADLLLGQYRCAEVDMDPETQQAVGCDDSRTIKVPCFPAPHIICDGKLHNGSSIAFYKRVPCKWTNGRKFETALLLSIFLGMFGIDRFYLGYPAIGLLKLSTLGLFFLGQLIDILLIAAQVVKPADGSDYVIDHYGPGVDKISLNNFTFFKPADT